MNDYHQVLSNKATKNYLEILYYKNKINTLLNFAQNADQKKLIKTNRHIANADEYAGFIGVA